MSLVNGILTKAIAGFYFIDAGDGIYECKARGIFRKNSITPTVGDRVTFEVLSDGKGVLCDVLPRKNILVRPPVANIDRLFIVSSQCIPAPNTLVIDRLTAIAVENDIEPILVFNKSDLGDLSKWVELYTSVGFKTVLTSTVSGEGCDEVLKLLDGKISAFTGNSGVGKSSLLNKIIPKLSLKTGEVSEKLGRGRHTTRHTELYRVGGGYVADTPGFSALETVKTMSIKKENLQFLFPEFEKYLGGCKFVSCTHTGEKGCAIERAAEEGIINRSRLESYHAFYNEIKDIKQWEIK